MKFPYYLLAALMLAISCDKKENTEALEAVSGHWHVWNFEPSAGSSTEDSLLAKEAILKLVAVGCDPIEFTFKVDGSVYYKDGMRYLSASMGDDGVEVSCASQYDTKAGSFDYDFTELTLNYDSETIVLDTEVDDMYLRITVDDMLINGVEVSGKLIFIRETGQ